MNLQLNLSQLHGWIILDKGMGCSSARAVSQIKKLFGASKVGHAGTLDPLATGVLPVALGEAPDWITGQHTLKELADQQELTTDQLRTALMPNITDKTITVHRMCGASD